MTSDKLHEHLNYLKLYAMLDHYESLANEIIEKHRSPVDYLSQLIEHEVHRRQDRAFQRRIKAARIPIIKTLENFQWDWPTKIDRLKIQNLFRLNFVETHHNIIFIGGVGLGKSHLATALAYNACIQGHSVLFTTAVDAINNLVAAQAAGRLKMELRKYLKPALLILDEIGYIPIDKLGADLLFQIVSQRYEKGSIIVTTNRPYKKWSDTFNNDTTLTSAMLDRLLHHSETVVIQGRSYRANKALEN